MTDPHFFPQNTSLIHFNQAETNSVNKHLYALMSVIFHEFIYYGPLSPFSLTMCVIVV